MGVAVENHSRRTRRALYVAVAAIVAAVGIAAVIRFGVSDGGQPSPGEVVFEDDFSQAAGHWSLDSYKGITSEIADGGYRVSLEVAGSSHLDGVAFSGGEEFDGVRVETRFRFERATKGATVGVVCSSSPGDDETISGLFGRYYATVGLDGRVQVTKTLNADEELIASGESRGLLRRSGTNELSMACRYAGNETTIELDVNGERAIETQDDSPLAAFESVGMYAGTDAPGLEVVFDDLQATRTH